MRQNKEKIKSMSRKKDDLLRLLLESKNAGKEITWNNDYDELSKYLFSDGYVFEKESKQEIPVINLKGEDFLRKGGYVRRDRVRLIWAAVPIITLIMGLVKCNS